ncbi:MAG: hypothetical protein JKY56_22540 [Kofleriaceae bacterium]|nr:hypothetical protein [Kofleriaceae bacterium]
MSGKLMWSRSRRCEMCGHAEEHDTDDEGMAFFRNILITECSYGVELAEVSKSELILVLQAARPLSLRDADLVSASLLSGQWAGTRPEAALLAEALQERGHVARVTDRRSTP